MHAVLNGNSPHTSLPGGTIEATKSHAIQSMEDACEIPTYDRWPIALESGSGSYVTDSDGHTYLDFYGGHCVTLLGHNHPRVVSAIKEQADKLLFYSNVVYSEVRARAASTLIGMAGSAADRVFFCNSGTEANETALKIARKATGRQTVIAMTNGFHGRTMGSLSVTWNPKYRDPYSGSLSDTVFVPMGDLLALRLAFESSSDIAAVIMEPIQSMAGVLIAPPDYYVGVRSLCDTYGAQLILDEIQTGVGRTGTFLYSEQLGICPDMTTLAKSLASGVPVGAVLVNETTAATIKAGDQGTTFGGGMLAMAAMSATLDSIAEQDTMLAARRIFDQIRSGVADLPVNISGAGCLIGLRFDRAVAPICASMRERFVLVGGSSDPTVMRLMPPATSTTEDVTAFLFALNDVVDSSVSSYL